MAWSARRLLRYGTLVWVAASIVGRVEAAVPPPSPVSEKAYRHPDLYIPSLERRPSELPATWQGRALDLAALGASPDTALFDWRAGRWGSLVLSQPLLPGDGLGNRLPPAGAVTEGAVWKALTRHLRRHRAELGIDPTELASPAVGIHEGGRLVQVHARRVAGGIPVRDSGLAAVVSHGNLVLLGLQAWGTIDSTVRPVLSAADAQRVASAHFRPFEVSGFREAERLELVPLARGQALATVAEGQGYDYRLAWVVNPAVEGDAGTWEALVDARTGELIAFQDTNQYAVRRVIGGVYPVSNDQRPPDGIEQAGWPMPYTNVAGSATSFTTTGGVLTACETGTIQTTLQGQFVRVSDVCGPIIETSPALDLDLGSGPTPQATDCTVPAGHSPGDTKAARTAFYELNRIKEQARGYLPANAWLQGVLPVNTNINSSCGAFWSGSAVSFYRSSAQCRNTGENPGIADHEWGHGLDQNGVNGNITNPGEAIADIYSVLRLNSSCVGRGFFTNNVCSGYGDPCVGTPATGCTGVRDADFAQHVSGLPHGITWILANCPPGGGGPCNRLVHCEAQIPDETAWDLQFRDLRAAPFNYDSTTALELTTRLMYLAPQVLTSWYTCAPGCAANGTCGCGATGGYMLTLAADDDDGNLANGTPHMGAIRAAFERHEIHCSTPAVANSGCSGGPTTAPAVAVAPTPGGASLAWSPVPGAATYAVYRTEGVNGCDFGKTRVGQTSGTTFIDSGLLDGRTYFYAVMPLAGNTSCLGPMSSCQPVVPALGPDPCVPVELTTFAVE